MISPASVLPPDVRYLRRLDLVDAQPDALVGVVSRAFADGRQVRLAPGRWVLTGHPGEAFDVHLSLHVEDVAVDEVDDKGHANVTVWGIPVLTPPFSVIDLPTRVAEARQQGPGTPVEVVLFVPEVTIGPRA